MSLKLLDDCTRSFLRSGAAISCISQCVEELVLNSIDAGAQSIAVRVDVPKLFMQITDNGTGISYDDLQLLGERYATSKCHAVKDLDNLCFHGYRGEAVASIIDCCGVVEFSTKHCLSSSVYCKTFHRGRSLGVRPLRNECSNIGTTVTIHDIFYNLPVRRKIISDVTEIDKIRRTLSAIALIHPNVSLILRNNQTSERLMQTKKTNSILQSFELLFGPRLSLGLQEVHVEKHGFTVHGCISINSHYTKSYQFIYLNKRYIKNTRLHTRINQMLSSSLLIHKPSKLTSDQLDEQKHYTNMDSHGVFVFNIECSLNEYDITLEPAKTLVEFKRWDDVLTTVESLVMDFLLRNNLTTGIPSIAVEEKQDVATSLPSQATPQNTLEYGLRSRSAYRKALHVSFTMDSFDEDDPNCLSLDCSTPVVSSCVSEGKENNPQLSLQESQNIQPCKRRKVLSKTTLTESVRRSNDDHSSHHSVIQLNAPMRSSTTTSNINTGQRTLLATAKQFGNRNNKPVGPESTKIPRKRFIEKPSYLKDKISIEGTKELQHSAADCTGCVFQDQSTKTMNTMFPFSMPAINEDKTPTNEHCSHNGRVVATTYSFITPLSRDRHMTTTNRSSTDSTSNNEWSHNALAHDDRVTEIFDASNEPCITNGINCSSNDNKDVVSIDSLMNKNQDVFSDHAETNIALEQSMEVTDDTINSNTSYSPSIMMPQTHNTTAINSTSGDSCYELFGHSPLRAAPHLTYGLGPLKPRAKDARRFPIEGSHRLQQSETALPESKWRDKAGHVPSSVISNWTNPALSAGNADILNIGMSSGSSSSIKIHSVIHQYKFTKDIFKNLEVLGQVDCKFIACLLRSDSDKKTVTNCLLVFFDQHAVHERIRVEALSKDAYSSDRIKTITLDPPQTIVLSESEKTLSIVYRLKLERAGIVLSHDRGTVFVHAMPSVFDISEKGTSQSTVAMDLVQELVSKFLDLFCSGRSVGTSIPPTTQRVLNSKACHGAIKFGDPLTVEECSDLIKSLSLCKLPFQCAHGRPSLIPLLDLNQLKRRYPDQQPLGSSVNIKKLRELHTKVK